MRIRARHVHAVETLIDNVVGLAINFAISLFVFNHILGQDISLSENGVVSVVMFIIAYIRKYTLRRWSSNLIGRIYEDRKAQEDAELQKQAGKD